MFDHRLSGRYVPFSFTARITKRGLRCERPMGAGWTEEPIHSPEIISGQRRFMVQSLCDSVEWDGCEEIGVTDGRDMFHP